MAAKLDGPRTGAKQPRQLVVLLHGYGADGKDLIGLASQWQPLLPDAAFVAPHAPEPCAQAPMGRQWFPLTMRDPDERWKGVNKAAPQLDAFLDAELAAHGLDGSRLAIVGFSQGTMMALHVGLRRARLPGAIVGFSGLLVGPEHLGDLPARRAPPILLTHGTEDAVIPVDALFMAGEDLAAAGIPSQWHLSMGVGHGIDGGALRHAGLFLARSLGVRLTGAAATAFK
jgi:phospholipase/carboxylesterase